MRTSLRCAEWTLLLEVIRHDCTQSRMLRGATIDESMLRLPVAVRTRDLYYGRELRARKDQEVAFLSYRELIESIRIPRGRE